MPDAFLEEKRTWLMNQQIIDEISRAIIDAVSPEKIILFGSWVSGQVTPQSDLDILIVERENFGPKRTRPDEVRKIRRALRPFRMPKDVLVCSADEAVYWSDSLNNVMGKALREGRVLYERS